MVILRPLRRRRHAALLLMTSVTLSACSGTTVHRVMTPADDACEKGFRYYEPAPYVLVYSDGKTGLSAETVMLPDLSRKMAARPYNFISSNTTDMKFTTGFLTDAQQIGDETAFPKAVIDAAEAAAIAAAKGAAMSQVRRQERPRGKPGFKVPTPYLYKIVIDETGVYLRGGPGLTGDGAFLRVVKFDKAATGGGQ